MHPCDGRARDLDYLSAQRAIVLLCGVLALYVPVTWSQRPFSARHSSRLPSNGDSCTACHAFPAEGGSSRITVTRAGNSKNGKYYPAKNGGILHTRGDDPIHGNTNIRGLRISLSLFGDGYVEAVSDIEFRQIALSQTSKSRGKVHGEIVYVSPQETGRGSKSIGRFGWKAQHASILDATADALLNELGIPNRIYPARAEGNTRGIAIAQDASGSPSDELDEMVDFVRNTEPVAPDPERSTAEWSRAGSQIFDRIGCSLCHVRTLKTAPAGTKMKGSNIVVSEASGDKEIHPFSDYLLHDVGTGDGIVQNVRPEDYDDRTANKFRTAPLWGVRFRSWLMHDGKSVTYHQAIMRHGGEASDVVHNYVRLSPVEKEQLRLFLDSL